MSKQDIVDRILSDAEKEAEAIIAEANATAESIMSETKSSAEREMESVRADTKLKAEAILAGKQATARLDGAKILLAEKRAVIDDVYARAAKQLGEMNEHDLLSMTKKLLEEYAEDGDEIVFADGYPCVKQVSTLDVVKDRHLKITFVGKVGGKVDGGFMLCGKTSDKDLSFAALLAADRAQHETEIAAELFKK